MQIEDLPIFIAGDANGCRSILHEALDEGFIAGSNAVAGQVESFSRRCTLKIVFSDPQIASVGQNPQQLKEDGVKFVTGSCDFSTQARAMLEYKNYGAIKIYIASDTGLLLGGEMLCTAAEHLAHQLALAVQSGFSVFDMLKNPFYHPVVEEGLRSALRDAASHLPDSLKQKELGLCQSCPEQPLC